MEKLTTTGLMHFIGKNLSKRMAKNTLAGAALHASGMPAD
jgi:hypothetical protein